MYIGGMPRYTGKTSVSSNGSMSTGMIYKGREIHKVDHDLQGEQSVMINAIVHDKGPKTLGVELVGLS